METTDRKDTEYEIAITYLAAGEHEADSSLVYHVLVPEKYYPPLDSQDICASDNDHLTIGCLELDLSCMYEDVAISVKDPDESIFQRALASFKLRARPLYTPCLSSSGAALIEIDSQHRYTIFDESEIKFVGSDQISKDVPGVFVAKGTFTGQDNLHVFQFSRRLPDTQKSATEMEARQFEVFLCIFNELSNEIDWFIQTTTAGETSRSQAAFPETSWALHPYLPLFVWLLPGHGLKISNIESVDPPITIAG
jgi:hypothetical protein